MIVLLFLTNPLTEFNVIDVKNICTRTSFAEKQESSQTVQPDTRGRARPRAHQDETEIYPHRQSIERSPHVTTFILPTFPRLKSV